MKESRTARNERMKQEPMERLVGELCSRMRIEDTHQETIRITSA